MSRNSVTPTAQRTPPTDVFWDFNDRDLSDLITAAVEALEARGLQPRQLPNPHLQRTPHNEAIQVLQFVGQSSFPLRISNLPRIVERR